MAVGRVQVLDVRELASPEHAPHRDVSILCSTSKHARRRAQLRLIRSTQLRRECSLPDLGDQQNVLRQGSVRGRVAGETRRSLGRASAGGGQRRGCSTGPRGVPRVLSTCARAKQECVTDRNLTLSSASVPQSSTRAVATAAPQLRGRTAAGIRRLTAAHPTLCLLPRHQHTDTHHSPILPRAGGLYPSHFPHNSPPQNPPQPAAAHSRTSRALIQRACAVTTAVQKRVFSGVGAEDGAPQYPERRAQTGRRLRQPRRHHWCAIGPEAHQHYLAGAVDGIGGGRGDKHAALTRVEVGHGARAQVAKLGRVAEQGRIHAEQVAVA
eukprot:scaffold2907_cov112-Isochrysis_galbana.AAC.1